jgi:hypothetical protein
MVIPGAAQVAVTSAVETLRGGTATLFTASCLIYVHICLTLRSLSCTDCCIAAVSLYNCAS